MELKAKNILILLLFKHVFINCEGLLQEYCEADDEDCQSSINELKIGQLQHGKSQHVNILRRIRNKSLMECAKECFLTSRCQAFNYRKNWKLCDALGERPDGEAIQDESGSVYSDISTWPKTLAGECADHNCGEGKKCFGRTKNGDFNCEDAYCKGHPPETLYAVSSETFGIYANLEAGNQHKCINSTYKLVGKPFVICDKKSNQWKKLFCCVEKPYEPRDCFDIPRHCDSGIYKIYPGTSAGFNIYCDNRSYWWNVFQRRKDGSVKFYRNWTEYEEGFGDLRNEFWLGNKLISQLTSSGNFQLRVTVRNRGGMKKARYSGFTIGNATTQYKLEVKNFINGSAGNSISNTQPDLYSNGMKFSTYDKDNDLHADENCAKKYKGAWWFNKCHTSHLNGEYDQTLKYPLGMQWSEILGTLRYSVMEIRRTGPLN